MDAYHVTVIPAFERRRNLTATFTTTPAIFAARSSPCFRQFLVIKRIYLTADHVIHVSLRILAQCHSSNCHHRRRFALSQVSRLPYWTVPQL
ncbi:hypothetical protein OE88DRAFT_1662540 [Heliocybe sulcata]|uniref:Uncharacterized protein n=1 Tax=Heliocybe sulcata TaxID=5364 RepID=A0A5C3N7R9_9AGAM|nr:hypothetical protein OE88DRAFT_1662540 [Heliocybe sulcata]